MANPKNTNPIYDKYLPIWLKCQDSTDGQEAIKDSGRAQKYLPMLPAQQSDRNNGSTYYTEYKEGAVWYGATGRTVSVLRGLPFRKPPVLEIPQSMEVYSEEMTTDSKSIDEVAKLALKEVIVKNRIGVLVDYPNVQTTDMTIAESQALNIRPYVAIYKAESILDWRETLINNKKVTSFITLNETAMIPDPEDEFNYVEQVRIRVLDLFDGLYRIRIYEQQDDDFILISEDIPLINGSAIDYIPFYPINQDGESWEVSPSVINDLANLNVAHYRNDASYRNGLLMTGNPTPYFMGLDNDASKDSTGKIRIGSHAALHLSDGGEVGYLQVGSDGFAEINRAGKDLEVNMSIIGARILAEEKKGVEAAETAAIHRAGENSVLSDMVNSVSAVMTKVLRLMNLWETGVYDDSISYQINTDFLAIPIDAQLLTSMIGGVQSGLISPQVFFYNLERGELIPHNVTYEEEEKRIKEYIGVEGESLDDEV